MKRITPRTIASVLFAFLMLAIGANRGWAQEVRTDFDPDFNYSKLRTYYWEKSDPVPGNTIVNQRIVNEVDRGLKKKGARKAPKGEADVAIAAHVTTNTKNTLEAFYGGWGGWGWGGWGPSTADGQTYLEGTLIIDMFDAKTNNLIWRGTATDTISDDQQKNEQHIQKAIQQMLEKDFPPDNN